MSWIWSWMKPNDPLSDLDPCIRDYLKNEAPKQYRPASRQQSTTPSEAAATAAAQQQQANPENTYRSQLGLDTTNDPEAQSRAASTQQEPPQQRPLPRESLFQDGRYAHLWSTYRPAAEVDEAAKSDQEKLLDIVSGYKSRQAEVGRAALENCADEQWAIHACFSSGGATARMTMCREENRALERCVLVQSRFLRALGYLAPYERTRAESEAIQMHADKLYHRMLDEEEAGKRAVAAGGAAPVFEPIVKPGVALEVADGAAPVAKAVVAFDELPEAVRKRYMEERFQGLEGQMLELGKRELEQEIAANQVIVAHLEERYRTERSERLKRMEEGNERVGDKVKRWFDMRTYGDDKPGQAQGVEKK